MTDFLPPIHWTNLLIIPGLLIGYTVHELGHALAAYLLGDYSQVEENRLTLNPTRHIAWFGAASFLLFGLGWSKPLHIDTNVFRERPTAVLAIALAGPLASLTLGLAALMGTLLLAATLVYISQSGTDEVIQFIFPAATADLPETFNLQALTMAFTSKIAMVSFWLAFISILPIPTMDGLVIVFSLYAIWQIRRGNPQQLQPQPVEPVEARHKLAPPPATKEPVAPIDQYERRNNVSDIHFKVGVEYHQKNQYDDAIARYRQAIANDQHFGPAYVNLGLAYLGKGRRREAIHAFRGAVQYADDQKSQQAAWQQLHQLSEVSPIDEDAEHNIAKMGQSPWTDTRPEPNWFHLMTTGGLLLVGFMTLYAYLFRGLLGVF